MAKTSYVQIPAGLGIAFQKSLQSGDRLTFSTMKRKNLFQSRRQKKGLSQKSLLPIISELWNDFSIEEKASWNEAGASMNYTGFRLFVQDQTLRMINEISGVATPSTLYQSHVGRITIEAPATTCKLTQLHPRTYWVSRAVRGKKGMREPVIVTEDFDLPITLRISYKADLTAVSVNARARFFAHVYSLYQGRTIENVIEVPFVLQHDWIRGEATFSGVLGAVKGYTLFIELFDVQGTLWFDNVEAYHSAQNWARDPHCTNIKTTFTKVYFQVPDHWTPTVLPTGANYGSVYYN